ncbi:CMP-N-acetylneuraminate-beta-galactosamide-alpha-2,3-sialyltransferase 1-like [Chanos chanos]|uniref:CMP-N-acetylneuraminate-beta-galactosamide-alpha-2,3-sialyltransferase 1 n=1 Tax=Chanos chanos TaxID=29144 RepID=A0A6J2WLV4_CHACN|nr:CMP-N-acetylneuraminate-beta-galactosamide-alpha-2,3-sialyltransferase 1-like [Chanos chanos]
MLNKKRNLRLMAGIFIIGIVCMFEYAELSYEDVLRLVTFARKRPANDKSRSCTTCVTGWMNDMWFTKRFQPSVRPLLSKRNCMLSENTYKWWQRLQYVTRRANYTKVVKELFQIIPGKDHYLDGGSDRCRVCSVLGNSGNLLGSHYGDQIDSGDCVIRMNKAPTKGYERDVGTRTTHHIFYPESAVNVSNDTNVVLFPFKTLDLEWLMSALTNGTIKRTRENVPARINADKDKVMVLSPAFMRYVHTSWLQNKGVYPSTGFLALIFSLHICDKVNVYGFGANRNRVWHHYFEPPPKNFRLNVPHSVSNEYSVILELSKRKKIQLFTGI